MVYEMKDSKKTSVDKYGHEIGLDWTTSQLARAAQLSPGRIRQLVASGQLEHYKLAPRLNLIPYHEGLQFLQSKET